MAQSGYTPILIYASGTATNVPLAANMTSSASGAELALNYADGKLYYKNSSGVVTLLVGTGGAGVVAGSNTQIQFNNSGVFGASSSLTWDGTYLTAGSIKDSALTSGRVTYAGASGLLTDSANLTFNGTTLTAGGLTTTGTTSTGVLSVTGNTTLGDAAADTLTVNATVTSNLIFTDNTYDIGASGATRPRSGYFGTTLVAGTNIGVGYVPEANLSPAVPQIRMSGATGASIISGTGSVRLGYNWIFTTSGADRYGGNGDAALYYMNAGVHRWYFAPTNSSGADVVIPYENNMLLSRYGNLILANGGATSSITATPWGTGYSSVEMKVTGTGIAGNSSATHMFNNAYDTSSGFWVYGVASKFASLMYQAGNSTVWQGTVSTQGAGNAITWQNLMQLTMPATNQVTLAVGNNSGILTGRNTILMNQGGYNDQPGNQTTASDGDKMVLYEGVNRSAMGIGSDYNWWSQSKSFEWWISPTNASTTVTQQLSLYYNSLNFGANDNTARYISVKYSTVPTYISSSFDGTNGLSTISSNTWNQSSGSNGWSSFNNTSYASGALQIVTASGSGYLRWLGSTAANTVPTVGGYMDKLGIISGTTSYNRASTVVVDSFPNWLSNTNLGTNRNTFFEGGSSLGGSNWFGLGTVPAYAVDWDTNTQSRWVNNSGTWAKTHEVLRSTGMESQLYNPAFMFEVATGAVLTAGWNTVAYDVAGGSRTLSRNGVGYNSSNTFTAPQTGWYFFAAQISFSSSTDADGTIKFGVNGSTTNYGPSVSQVTGGTYPASRSLAGALYLTAGDYVQAIVYVTANSTVRSTNAYAGTFSGYFIG